MSSRGHCWPTEGKTEVLCSPCASVPQHYGGASSDSGFPADRQSSSGCASLPPSSSPLPFSSSSLFNLHPSLSPSSSSLCPHPSLLLTPSSLSPSSSSLLCTYSSCCFGHDRVFTPAATVSEPEQGQRHLLPPSRPSTLSVRRWKLKTGFM